MKYEPPVGGAANDPYVNGDKSTGTEGSIPPAEAIEHPMREVVNVITQMGITPDEADLTQLFAAMSRMSARGVTTVAAADSPKALTVAEAGLVLVDASGGNVTLTLPTAANNGGLRYVIARMDSSANTVTVAPDGTDTIDGAAASITVDSNGGRRDLACDDASDWLLAVTQASMAPAFAERSEGASGYQVFPGGLILNWTIVGQDTAGVSVTWPLAFTSLIAGSFVQSASGNPSITLSVGGASLTGCMVYASSTASSLHYCFALGF